VWIFGRKSRTRRTLGSHQIWVFRRHSEQLIGREARRELEEASAHVLGAEASPEAALTITKHRPSHVIIAGLRCRPPSIKVRLVKFPSSLWSRRSKPHRNSTTMARENSNSSEPPRLAMACRREREPAPPPAGANRPPSDLARTVEIWSRVPFHLINPSRRTEDRWRSFYVVCGPVRPDPMDSVYQLVDPVCAFSNRKII
jgi:hypothetical protein